MGRCIVKNKVYVYQIRMDYLFIPPWAALFWDILCCINSGSECLTMNKKSKNKNVECLNTE